MPIKNVKNLRTPQKPDEANARKRSKADSSSKKEVISDKSEKGFKVKDKESIDKLEKETPRNHEITEKDALKFINGVDRTSMWYNMSERKGKPLTKEEKEKTFELLRKSKDYL